MVTTRGLPNKVKLSDEAFSRLKWLKSKTGLEDWTIARLGFCFSIGESHTADLKQYLGADSQKEFNRYTITGEQDLLYTEMLRTYLTSNQDLSFSEADAFRAHINRGIIALSRQVRSIYDLADLLERKS